jgi:hypothetical protein
MNSNGKISSHIEMVSFVMPVKKHDRTVCLWSKRCVTMMTLTMSSMTLTRKYCVARALVKRVETTQMATKLVAKRMTRRKKLKTFLG